MFPRQIRLNGPLIYASARPACKSHRRGLEAVSRFIVPRGSVPGRFSGTREVAVKRHSPSLFRLFSPPSLSFPYFPMAEKQGTAFRDINLPTNGYITSGFFHDGQKGMDGERERERRRKVSSSAFRANIAGNSAGVPNCPRFAYAPGFVSQGKRNEREKASSSLPIAKNNFFVGCSFSRSLSRRDLFSRKTIPS